MDNAETQVCGGDPGDGSQVTLSAQELLSLVEQTISKRLAKDEPKAKVPKTDPLRFKGNQKQLDFNMTIREGMPKVGKLIQADEGGKAYDVVLKMKDEIDSRNKMIRLADRSGWDVVDEYMGDTIASDSDDERRIRAAEQRATRKRRGSSSFRPFRQGARGRWSRAISSFNTGHYQGSTVSGQPEFFASGSYPVNQVQHRSMQFQNSPNVSQNSCRTKTAGACYYCGDAGHWAMECPRRKK